MRTIEELRTRLAESLREHLSASGYFGAVSVVAEDSEQNTDFTIIGAFTQAKIGSNSFNLYNILTSHAIETPSTISIAGGILRAKEADPVTTFQCHTGCCKVRTYNGIPLQELHTGLGKMKASISAISQNLENAYRGGGKRERRAEHK
jgi:hypothetical protein